MIKKLIFEFYLLISDFVPQKPANVGKKDHSFYEPQLTRHYKKYTPATQPKHVSGWCQKKNISTEPFLDALKLHFWSTWTANVSNLRSNIFVPETLKAFIWRWQNSSPQGNRCLGLVGKFLRFFYLIEIYKCLTAFRISILPSMALNVL